MNGEKESTMSDSTPEAGAMSADDEIAALRSDMAATSTERDVAAVRAAAAETAAAAAMAAAAQANDVATAQRLGALAEATAQHNQAMHEIADLQAKAAADAMPDAEIKAGLHAIRQKFAGLF
jgi:hypothetical protein